MSLAPDLVEKLMRLSERERAQRAHQLLPSLEEPEFDGDWESLWAEELHRRSAMADRDETIGTDWRAAVDRIRHDLRRGKGG